MFKGSIFTLSLWILFLSMTWSRLAAEGGKPAVKKEHKSLSAGQWSEPVLLEELNDSANDIPATRPCLSKDGLTMYFMRDGRIMEAYRDAPSGPFTSERAVTELDKGYGIWVSEDELRLYYAHYEYASVGRRIRLATRNSKGELWQDVGTFTVIHKDGHGQIDTSPTLTADELTMFYESNRTGIKQLWTATRASITDGAGNFTQFENPTRVIELADDDEVWTPYIAPDGLTIYYGAILYGDTTRNIYKATRPSFNDPFENIEKVGISTDLYWEWMPYLTDDAKTLYFYSRRANDIRGIWVSHKIIQNVIVDIKPGSSRNPLNVKGKGMLPVAILGAEDFDVHSIMAVSIRLEGVAALRQSYQDVAGPEGAGPDGFIDLTLKFKTQDIVGTFGEVNHEDVLTLVIEGVLTDETAIEGSDEVTIVGKHKPLNQADINKDGIVDLADFAIISKN
ncbi:MAG: hypothetical protein AMJ79_14975 [Phycisphaerae bacterium SM23_30]|nr:MAG: hypothetical protein AMJ79_14975 [Phycisphaerae bacterium SM23_30]